MSIREFTNIYGDSPDTVLVYNVIFNSVFKIVQKIVDLNNTEILFRDMTVGEIGRKTFSLIHIYCRLFVMKTSYWFSPFEMDKRQTVSYHTDTSYCPLGTVSLSFI